MTDVEPPLLDYGDKKTETIDLSKVLTRDLTKSGSFDTRGEIWATTFGKVIQSLPIPAMLIDETFGVVVVNEACGRVSKEYESILDGPFLELFSDPTQSREVHQTVQDVFSSRRPGLIEALISIKDGKLWGRLTFRSIRTMDERLVLVLVEDLTSEKRQIQANRRHHAELEKEISRRELSEEELRRTQDKLEHLVEQRTAELTLANEKLKQEIQERDRAERALRVFIGGVDKTMREDHEQLLLTLERSLKPLINELKSQDLPERSKLLLESLERNLPTARLSFVHRITEKNLTLTPREIHICELIYSGLTSKQIATILGVTPAAVNFHRNNIRKKLGIEDARENLANWLKRYLEASQ
jgi:DNA-binding CsgD family transcriptional regulator